MNVEFAKTPHLDELARTARLFTRHYVQVPTCGASRCALWRGEYPSARSQVGNSGIAASHSEWGSRSLPALFRQQGYQTLALGKLTHHPGGLTGKHWAEGAEELPGAWNRSWIPDGPWKTPEAIMHGYANGEARRPGQSPAWQAHDGPDEAYPDAWVAKEAVETLQQLSQQDTPWFFGVGFFKPHLPFAAPARWHEMHRGNIPDLLPSVAVKPTWPSGWHASGEFRGNYGHVAGQDPDTDPAYARLLREAYAGCVSYVDAQVGRVLTALRDLRLEDNTIVILWSDHGFLLGEHAIWGKHCLYEQALKTPLMIRYPNMPEPGATCSALVETIDVFPTLLELCKIPAPKKLDGNSLMNHLVAPNTPSTKSAHSFWSDGQRSVRTDRWRLIVRQDKNGDATRLELFDYQNDRGETRNVVAEQPETVQQLLAQLEKLPQPSHATAK